MRKISAKLLSPIWFLLKTYSKEILVTVLPVTAILLWGDKIWQWLKSIWTQKVTVPQVEIVVSNLVMIVLASLIALALLLYSGYKIKNLKKSKVRYIELNKLIWKVQRSNDKYKLEPLCIKDYTSLKLLLADYLRPDSYYYRCEWCGEEYSTDIVDSEQHVIESKIDNFGIKHFKNRFVNVKRKVKPLNARSK